MRNVSLIVENLLVSKDFVYKRTNFHSFSFRIKETRFELKELNLYVIWKGLYYILAKLLARYRNISIYFPFFLQLAIYLYTLLETVALTFN